MADALRWFLFLLDNDKSNIYWPVMTIPLNHSKTGWVFWHVHPLKAVQPAHLFSCIRAFSLIHCPSMSRVGSKGRWERCAGWSEPLLTTFLMFIFFHVEAHCCCNPGLISSSCMWQGSGCPQVWLVFSRFFGFLLHVR